MRHPKTRWPWISLLLTVALGLSPLGQELFYSAFLSGEQLSRNISQPIFFMGLGGLLFLMLCEYGIRSYLRRSR